jgi:hypothetical protein
MTHKQFDVEADGIGELLLLLLERSLHPRHYEVERYATHEVERYATHKVEHHSMSRTIQRIKITVDMEKVR